ncbi:NAD(P)/FAD-dependent oxidoreductase [Undibacterium sp. RuTC16W]|uniref:NAD(P)/FAD-dependent oxidoreductase n=1 Tax=Undibacterium sp. RuTC16W TaxID=3413048 RepID=UPI003BF2A415
MNKQFDTAIVGAGFTGLTAALELARKGQRVLLLESDTTAGGLAGTFEFKDGVKIEKFYHHWFDNDVYVPQLVKELGLEGEIVTMPSKTGMYFNGRHWRLSTPLDLLRFKPLSFFDRIRLGLLVLQVRRVKDWKAIEHLSIREWLEPLCGKNVYRIVWQPLIENKFSVFSEAVNAVWMWKKLVLRGSTRDAKGGEQLAYFKGGFGRLAQAMVDEIVRLGGEIRFAEPVRNVIAQDGHISGLQTDEGIVNAKQFLFTPAFPVIASIFDGTGHQEWLTQMRRVKYLANACLVLELDRSLSDTYWLNVNDPGFPFVGVIEHTNFDSPANYDGKHIVFLSRYLAKEDPLWSYGDQDYLNFALEHLQRMFPALDRSWISDFRIWRAEYAQPVTERGYSSYVPGRETPFSNAWISTMAQIYPEDRGTNYAIREGKAVAHLMLAQQSK